MVMPCSAFNSRRQWLSNRGDFTILHAPSEQGRPSPWGNDAFSSPVSDFPLFSKNFGLRRKFPKCDLSKKNFWFSSAKISDDLFLVIHCKFWISLFQFISSPYFGKFFFPLLLQNFPSDFVKLTCFYILYMYFVPPTFTMMHLCIYASHNARTETGRPCIQIDIDSFKTLYNTYIRPHLEYCVQV